MSAAAKAVGVGAPLMRQLAKIAAMFPPGRRDPSLTFDHHRAAMHLPSDEAAALLARAKAEALDSHATRIAAIKRKALLLVHMPRDDPEYDEMMAIALAWNRARPQARELFVELQEEAGLGLING